MNPGWITQVRIDISAIVTPLEDLTNDRRLRTWPTNVTKTVTNDNSMVLAKSAKTIEAVAGLKVPPVRMTLPYLGLQMDSTSQRPDHIVEYIESIS